MSETVIDRGLYGNYGGDSSSYSTAAYRDPATLTPLSVPTHMQHVPSRSNLSSIAFSDADTDSEDYKSRSSGIEADIDRLSPLQDDFDALLGAQEAACTRACSTHLQGYIEDLELITHAAGKDLRAVTGLSIKPEAQESTLHRWRTVSYTHLTLPTIYSV